jgi:hypothetical protein
MMTSRYLDPPVIENYTNSGSSSGFSTRADHDWSDTDRTRIYFHHRQTGFLVPNELLQQAAGQRQDRTAKETMAHLSHQHVFSPRVLGGLRVMARDTAAALWSNPLSTPIAPAQDRGFREVYSTADVSATLGNHEFKAGVEAIFGSIHEDFSYRITAYRLNGVRIFDREAPQTFHFQDRRQSREQSAFVQDRWRIGNLTVSAGVRFDHYRLVADATAWSPRLGIAYHVQPAGLVLRASYDRTFETPAVENILLSSSDQVQSLGGEGVFLPLQPSRGNFYEAGFSKTLGRFVRLDGTWYKRLIDNFADDGVLFNTGVSFPITFSRGEIQGYEAKLDIPRLGNFSGFVSYANMTGRGYGPVTGGLFLGDDVDELLETGTFPITQDQRNTLRARGRYQVHPRLWTAVTVSDPEFLESQLGRRVLDRVDLERGRVRPSSSIDFSVGFDLLRKENQNVRLIGDVLNLTNRLNVINFSGLFSGTAIEPARSYYLRLQVSF